MTDQFDITTAYLDDLERKCDDATQGTWSFDWRAEDGVTNCGIRGVLSVGYAESVCRAPRLQTQEQWEHDASFICAMNPQIVRQLIDALRQQLTDKAGNNQESPCQKETDIDAYVAQQWPELPSQQQRSLATWLDNGWAFVSIGNDGEVNLQRGEGKVAERGYIRQDGIYRPE